MPKTGDQVQRFASCRKWVPVPGIILMLLGLTLACSSGITGVVGPSREGPLKYQGEGVGAGSGFKGQAPSEFVFGGNWFENTGDTDVTLSSAVLIGDVDPNIAEVVEARIFRMNEATDEVGAFGIGDFADAEARLSWKQAHSIGGLEVTPGEVVALYFKIEVHKEGEVEWPGAELHYSAEDRDYVVEADHVVMVCLPIGCTR